MKTPKQLAKQIEHLTTLRVTEIEETDDPTIEDDSITIQDGEISWYIQIGYDGRFCLNQWIEDGEDTGMLHSKIYNNLPVLLKNELPQYLR